MSESASAIDKAQQLWADKRPRDARRKAYLQNVEDNLCPHALPPESRNEFLEGDGSELRDSRTRPAKMRALASSSALAVNFFGPWRNSDKGALAAALGLPAAIEALRFEYRPTGYPVRPRSPNLDLLLHLANGEAVAVESKFSEPFRSADGHGLLSARYFPPSNPLWAAANLGGAQALADRLRSEWLHLDVPQLLKHLLGLAYAPEKPGTLLYVWYDTGLPDATAHRREIERFAQAVDGGAIRFRSVTYQEAFRQLSTANPVPGWSTYMAVRYFS